MDQSPEIDRLIKQRLKYVRMIETSEAAGETVSRYWHLRITETDEKLEQERSKARRRAQRALEREKRQVEQERAAAARTAGGKAEVELAGRRFEEALATYFQGIGYSVELTPTSGDQGVDLIMTEGSHKIAVQAKDWIGTVGNGAVQEVFTGMHYYGAKEAWVITTSSYTAKAQALARTLGVRLVAGEELARWLCGEVMPSNKS